MATYDKIYSHFQHLFCLFISLTLPLIILACNSKPKPNIVVSSSNNLPSSISPQSTLTVKDSSQVKPSSNNQQLEIGKPVEQILNGGEIHSYTITVETNQYLHAVIEQKGIDVVASIYNPSGEKVYEIDSPNGSQGPEYIHLITPSAGNYRLAVESLDQNVNPAKYEVSLLELHTPLPRDEEHAEGFRFLIEAEKLKAEEQTINAELLLSKYQEASKLLEKVGDYLAQATAMEEMASMYFERENYKKAEALYLKVLEIRKKSLGENHLSTTIAVVGLANVYVHKEKYKEAETLYLEVLEIRKKTLGENHPYTAIVLGNLASLYYKEGNYEKAEPLYLKVLEIRKKTLGLKSKDTAMVFESLANIYSTKNDLEKAEEFYLIALKIYDKIGEENSNTASVYNDLGFLYESKKDYENAGKFYLKSLDIEKKLSGSKPSSSTAKTLHNLGRLYLFSREYEKSEKYCFEALEMWRQLPEIPLTDMSLTLHNLALLYQETKNYEKAKQFFIEALKNLQQNGKKNDFLIATFFNSLSILYQETGKIEEAIKYKEIADDSREKELAKNLFLGSEKQKSLYLQKYYEETNQTISLHMQLAFNNTNACRAAFIQILRRKGRSVDAISQNPALLRKRLSPENAILFDELAKKKASLSNLITQGVGKNNPKEYQEQIKKLQDEVDNLQYQISERSIEFRTQIQPITLQDIQQAVPQNATLIEFTTYRPIDFKSNSYGNSYYVAYLLNAEGI